MNIENISITDIVPYENNARLNKDTIKAVEISIKKYGFNQPLVVRELNGKYEIVVGHTRYYAALNLGRKSLPCLLIDLDEDKIKQYRIIDNKTSETSQWDITKLIRELQCMENPFDVDVFFPEGLSKLLGEYTTSSEIVAFENAQKEKQDKANIHYESTGYEQPRPVEVPLSDIEVKEDENGNVLDNEQGNDTDYETNPVNTVGLDEKDMEEFEKRKENFENEIRGIQQERQVRNRSYKEVVCPKCGKKFILKQY